jgi:hypothetical protein
MKYRAIIHDSWVLTQENKKLIWWFGFIPALLTSLVTMGYLGYQVAAFWTSPHVNSHAGPKSAMRWLFDFGADLVASSPGLAVALIIVAAFVGLAYLFLPVFTQGALIQLVAHIRAGRKVSVLQGFSFGFSRFLQLFEYHLLIKTFSIVSILTEVAFVIRNFGPESMMVFGWVFLLVMAVALLLALFFTYSEYYIVIDNTGVFKSIISSGGLVVRQLHHTLFMFLLMAIISLRIIINVLVALIVPILVIAPIFFFASITLTWIGVVVGAVVGLIALYFSAYFLGVFHVFATAVWTFTFLELTTHEEELDLRAKAEVEKPVNLREKVESVTESLEGDEGEVKVIE